ncbi:hypothetical protein AOR_1_330174 [Paecilomyces variotii No. 5]|uniref:Uncharacterized protein n=1 Tax=Byssochlamys spectabilis (strain No. 5 / NBRC 109023) TaxID=1356009 RepID=V5FBC8_BYSSN|nr:hypothetical protein AOR_1_330174 [Paecilomyces variotii No. 5]
MARPKLPAAQVADAESRTLEQIFSVSMFASPEDLYKHALNILSTATSHQELVYKNVPPAWAQTILDRLDNRFEGRFRKNYNSITSTVWIRIMPTRIHDCHHTWAITQKGRWNRAGLTTPTEDEELNFFVGTTIPFATGPYSNSTKEPDLLIQPNGQPFPSVVIESGWSESLSRLQDDMNLWLVGGQGQVKATIILNWQRVGNTDMVRGSVYLYTLDRNGILHLRQHITVFPAPAPPQAASEQLVLSRREIFGGNFFQGQNPNDQFAFSIDLLRQKATTLLALMNLVPA